MAKTEHPGKVSQLRAAELEHAALVEKLTKDPAEILKTLTEDHRLYQMLFGAMELMIIAGNVLDLVKKQAFYNAERQNIDHPIFNFVMGAVEKQWIPKPRLEDINMLHMCIGVAGEGVEVMEHAHKRVLQMDPPEGSTLVEEIGDLEFFLQGLREAEGIHRLDTLAANLVKLQKRYAQGYSDAAAQARADKAQVDTAPEMPGMPEVIPPTTH